MRAFVGERFSKKATVEMNSKIAFKKHPAMEHLLQCIVQGEKLQVIQYRHRS
jgi:hypothetical protein